MHKFHIKEREPYNSLNEGIWCLSQRLTYNPERTRTDSKKGEQGNKTWFCQRLVNQ